MYYEEAGNNKTTQKCCIFIKFLQTYRKETDIHRTITLSLSTERSIL